MKKQRKKQRTKPQNKPCGQNQTQDRRDFMKYLRNGAIAVAVSGGGGYFAVNTVQASMAEHDLTKIGNGTPAIVQIHDPQCPVCRALQKEARRALRDFEDDDFEYLVANIRSKEGGDLANKYFVPHVTILLFDGKGVLRKVLNGSKTSDLLRDEFTAHLAASKSG
jgi:hypothetical protein